MIEKAKRLELIPELDSYLRRVDELRKELDSLLGWLDSPDGAWKDPSVSGAHTAAHQFVKALREAGDALKKQNEDVIRAYAVGHYRFRVELDIPEDEIEDPVIEQVEYAGNNRWFVTMTTSTHGREKMTIDSDTASWEQLYDSQPA